MHTKTKILSYAFLSFAIVGSLVVFGVSENAEKYQGSYIIGTDSAGHHDSDFQEMTYVPGEIIVKFAKNSGNIGSTSFSSYNDPSNPFLPANKELLKNATSRAAISQNVSQTTPPPNSINVSNYGLIHAQRQKAAEVAQNAGLDRIYFYEFEDLKKKAEVFHQKVFENLENKGMTHGTVQIQTPEYGLIRVNVPRNGNFVDPYTTQIVHILSNHPDVEYAEINKRVKFSEDWDWGEEAVVIGEEKDFATEEEKTEEKNDELGIVYKEENSDLRIENAEKEEIILEIENIETPPEEAEKNFEEDESEDFLEKIGDKKTQKLENAEAIHHLPEEKIQESEKNKEEYHILPVEEPYPAHENSEYQKKPPVAHEEWEEKKSEREKYFLEEGSLFFEDEEKTLETESGYLSPEEIERLRKKVAGEEEHYREFIPKEENLELRIKNPEEIKKIQESEHVETISDDAEKEEKPKRTLEKSEKNNAETQKEGEVKNSDKIARNLEDVKMQNLTSLTIDDPLFSQQWNFDSALNNDINLPEVFGDSEYKKGEGIIVAVIDSGIDYTHQDIDDNIWIQQNEIPSSFFTAIDIDKNQEINSREILTFFENQGFDLNEDSVFDFRDVLHENSPLMDNVDNDGNGYVDDLIGWDFYGYETNEDGGWDSGRDNNPFDLNGHGTHVTGVIAAEENTQGIVGVAPKVKIMPIRGIGTQGGGDLSGIISGIYYAIENGADVMNNSWGGIGGSNAVKNAMQAAEEAGIYVVAASGNNNSDVDTFFPANIETTISVGSHGPTGERSFFGNYGANLSLSAPGENILSLGKENSYAVLSGTSSATPHVSGIIAGILSSVDDKFSTKNMQHLIRIGTHTQHWEHFSVDLGYGKVDFLKTFSAAYRTQLNPDIVEPTQNGQISFGDTIYVDISDFKPPSDKEQLEGFENNKNYIITANAIQSTDQKSVEVCSGNFPYTPCQIDTLTNFYRENDTFLLEFKAFDENNHLIGRDAVKVYLNDISLEIENSGVLVYGSDVTIPVRFLIATGEEFTYDLFARPLSHEGQEISLRNGNGQGHLHQDLTFNTQHLPVSGKYELVLEVITRGKTVIRKKEIFVDLGLKSGFPIVDTTTEMSTEFFPIQILDFDEDISGKEIYSPKNNCEITDSGYPSCTAEKIVRFSENGNVKDVSEEFLGEATLNHPLHTKNFLASAGNSELFALTHTEYSEDDLGYSAREKGKVRLLSKAEENATTFVELELDTPLSEWHDQKNIFLDDINEDENTDVIIRTQGWESPCVDNSQQFLNILLSDANGNLGSLENGETNMHYNSADVQKLPITSPGENAFSMGISVANFSTEHDGKEIAILHRIDSCEGKTEEYRVDIFRLLDKSDLGDFENPEAPLLSIVIDEGSAEYPPIALDIEGDGIFELVIPRIQTEQKFVLFADVYSGNGEKIQEIQIAENEVSFTPTFAYADVNGDQKMDIVAGFGSHFSAFSLADGSMLFARTVTGKYQKESRLLATKIFIADLESDEEKEILLFTSDRTAQGDQDLSLKLFNNTGEEIKNAHFPKLFPSTVMKEGERKFLFPIPESMRLADLKENENIDFLFQSILETGAEHTFIISELGKGNILFDGNQRGNEQNNGRIETDRIFIPEQEHEEDSSENEENLPKASFSALAENLTVEFTNTSSENVSSFIWNFGDGNTSQEQNPTHTYASAGNYEIYLVAQNEFGKDEIKKSITLNNTNSPPVLNINGERRMVLEMGEEYKEPGYTAMDVEDGNLTSSVYIEGSVNSKKAGSYFLIYSVTDSNEAKAQISRNVKVKEKDSSSSGGAENSRSLCERPFLTNFYPERNSVIPELTILRFHVSDYAQEDDILVKINDQTQKYKTYREGEKIVVEVEVDTSLNTPGQKKILLSALSKKDCERASAYYLNVVPKRGDLPHQKSKEPETPEVGITSLPERKAEKKDSIPKVQKTQRETDIRTFQNQNISSPLFTDTKNHWSEIFVTKLFKKGLIQRKEDAKFYPDSPATRAEILKIIVEASSSEMEIETCIQKNTKPEWKYIFFPDVAPEAWYAKYACVAKVKGIVNGFADGTFGPEKRITRAESLKMMFTALTDNQDSFSQIKGNIFQDVNENDWFSPFVLHATREGIVKGYEKESGKFFLPYNPVTRAEASKMVVNVFEF